MTRAADGRGYRRAGRGAAGDIGKHAIDVASGKGVAAGSPDRRDLACRITGRTPMPRLKKSAANPRGHGELLALSEASDFFELLLGEQNLESFTHAMSIV